MSTNLLHGVRVLQLGTRTALRCCGQLLAHAGARLHVIDDADATPETADLGALQLALLDADIVIVSSDRAGQPAWEAVRRAARQSGSLMLCDITATGPAGPYARLACSDAEIQALTGLMDTTGLPGAPPLAIGLPYCEVSAGVYAAAAVAAGLLAWRRHGLLQDVDVSLYGAAANALTTFLPHVFAGHDPHRMGNRHSSAAPWNAYRTTDGWVLICTSGQEQWLRLAALVGDAALGAADFAGPRERMANADRLDALIEQWSQRLDSAACLRLCAAADVPAGPVLRLAQLAGEANVLHRAALAAGAGGDAAGLGAHAPFRLAPWPATAAPLRPAPETLAAAPAGGPLAGIRVVEIGQFTTAPLVGKHLAALGASVTKVEPPGGDPTRDWPHGQDDTSYFFALSNTDKRSVTADLKSAEGKALLRELLESADVFVENLRPGAMARLGFGPAQLAAINPRLVYCAISGFGADSAYPGRPAFDTVIQAMSGFMDLTRSGGAPVKAGISAADILSGQTALFGVIATLLRRDRDGAGAVLDIAMQDVAVWAAAQGDVSGGAGRLAPCADGYLLLGASAAGDAGPQAGEAAQLAVLNRADALALCARRQWRAVPVNSVADVVRDPHFRAHALGLGMDGAGRFWPILSPPYRFSCSPGPVGDVLAGAA